MLKRTHARICIIVSIIGVVFLSLGGLLVPNTYLNFKIIAIVLGMILIMAALVLEIVYLRCPSCREVIARPQWSDSGTIYCFRCGKPFIYDK